MYSVGDISDIIHVNTTVYILVGLQPYTTYNITIAAKTSQGRGPFSTAIEQATLEAGEAVQCLLNMCKNVIYKRL